MRLAFVFFGFVSCEAKAEGKFITGIGYIAPQEYRKDNEINPLPFGLSVVPMIAYRSKKLRVSGPNASYALKNGSIGLRLNLNMTGDRYEAYELDRRGTAVNGGVSLRLMNIILKYSSDISRVYNGNVFGISLVHRFSLGANLSLAPRITKEYLGKAFTRYYFGVEASETGQFPEYAPKEAVNDIYGMVLNYKLSLNSSLASSYSYKVFDNEIYKSPTISRSSYSTWAFFYNYEI